MYGMALSASPLHMARIFSRFHAQSAMQSMAAEYPHNILKY
jgi:hypothetical protein